jgi:hypothetical protein
MKCLYGDGREDSFFCSSVGTSSAHASKVPLCVQSERFISYMARHGWHTVHCH